MFNVSNIVGMSQLVRRALDGADGPRMAIGRATSGDTPETMGRSDHARSEQSPQCRPEVPILDGYSINKMPATGPFMAW